jgi:two-component system cell cycle sensor histidine kinase/response regulator CckA
VTDERAADAARAEIEQQFRQMAETIVDVMWLADANTLEILYVSPAFERIFGRPTSDLWGRTDCLMLAVHPDDRAHLEAQKPRLATGDYDETYRIVRPDGKQRWIRDRVLPVRDEEGKVVRLAGLSSDITTERQLEEQLLQARKMESVGRLAGGVAHDFNNLLTVILTASEFALRRLPEGHTTAPDIEQVKEAAERAAKLTHQLLAFARRQVIAPVRLDLNDLTRQMDALLRRVIGEHIELVTRLAPNLHAVLADPSQIEQVLVNLAVNARDAMIDGGRLTLETRNVRVDAAYAEAHAHVAPGDYAMLAVSDTGAGIPRDVQEHIFEPFFTTKAQGSGTGLGLATCYGIVRQAGGHIVLYSEVGRGSTFKILLPATNVEAKPQAPRAPAAPPGGHETILFVEDDQTVRTIGMRILSAQGYHVLEAASGREALRVAFDHRGPIHLLVTDVVMPHMSGTELARRLRDLRPSARVLYTSGYTENAIVHHGVLDPSLSFLPKPYIIETLLLKVRSVLDGTP